MSDNFLKIYNGTSYVPRSSDPSNPVEGDIQFSDGTARTKGLWQYMDGDWQEMSGGGGVGSPSIWGLLNAEDQDVTGWTNASLNTSTPLSGSASYDLTMPGNTPAQTVEERRENKLNVCNVQVRITSGSFKLQVKDQSSNILGESETISSTGPVKFSFFVNSTVTSATLHWVDVSSATGVTIDDIYFDDDAFVGASLRPESGAYSIVETSAANMSNVTGEIQFNTGSGTITIVEDDFFSNYIAVDHSTDPSTWTALKRCKVDVNVALPMVSANRRAGLSITRAAGGGAVFRMQGSSGYTGTAISALSDSFILEVGDVVKIVGDVDDNTANYPFGAMSASASSPIMFSMVATPEEIESVVYNATGTENTFAARIANNGTASIVSQSDNFIASVNRSGTGVVDVTWVSGFFTVAPTITGVTDNGGKVLSINSSTTTGAQLLVEAPGVGAQDHDMYITVGRQGTDYITPEKYVIVKTQQTCYLKDLKTSGTAGGSTSANTVHTRDLNTIEGDAFVTLSSNQFTLPNGTFTIKAKAPAREVDRHQLFLYNVTDSTYDIDGASDFSSSGGASGMSFATLDARITLDSSKTYEIRHWTQAAKATDGFGLAADADASNPQSNEVYTVVEITKVK